MPIKTLVNFLNGKKSRFEEIESRIRRLEGSLVKEDTFSGSHGDFRNLSGFGAGTQKQTNSRIRNSGQRARRVYGSRGWQFPREKKTDLKTDSRDEWSIEFTCPRCNEVFSEGIKHGGIEHREDHTRYQIHLRCGNCGWASSPINLKAFK
ncbi:MAG: hypothetical protein ACLFTQ_03805 [Candidatus Aenigmatarchaeota archaeon]